MSHAPLPMLGWKEQASLPDWGIPRLRVKLDTGARTSALHVEDLEVVDELVRDGRTVPTLRFAVVLGRSPDSPRKRVFTEAAGYTNVRDTSRRSERRPVVMTRVVCGPLDRVVPVTITDRTGMLFRMILGRTALTGVCAVDPARGYTVTGPPDGDAS